VIQINGLGIIDSNAGAASNSELLMANRESLVFMCFLNFGRRVWLPDRLTVIQEAARALWGVTLPEFLIQTTMRAVLAFGQRLQWSTVGLHPIAKSQPRL
jgi:hypothetical protein